MMINRWFSRPDERRRTNLVDRSSRQGRRIAPFRSLTAELLEDRRMLHALSTGSGDGSLNVGVDGYGSFGAAVFFDGGAVYDPIGSVAAASTTFESGVAIRLGNSGPRQFLTSGFIGSSGGLAAPPISGSSTTATSGFAFGSLNFSVLLTVAPLFNEEGTRTGSILTQQYQIVNAGASGVEFELNRYLDGDLLFDGTLVDGGGRFIVSGHEFLFETDAGGGGTTDTTFVGIDATGGTIPTAGRFEVDQYPLLEQRLIAGNEPDNTITGDTNGDALVDAGQEYDVTLVLRNLFNLAPGASTNYSTRTIFGSGNLEDVSITFPTVSIGDVAQVEGDAGPSDFVFSVSLSQVATSPVTLAYSTTDSTAVAGVDYVAQSGTLTFLPGGPTSQTVTIEVLGDTVGEDNETFMVQLTDLVDGVLGHSPAIGTILNDDVDLTISDVTVVEGNNGTSNAVFTVSEIGAVNQTISVSYATNNGTATAASDYLPVGGVLTFLPGILSRTITVPIVGDSLNELTEFFVVNLHEPVNGKIVKGVGVGTILDNDRLPALYVNDVQITTLEPLALEAVFTVALDTPSGTAVSVNYATADGTALGGSDYTPKRGTLVFPAGVTTLQVTVPVMTPAVYTPNETFFLNLTLPVHAVVGDAQGAATFVFSTPPVDNFIIDDGDPGYSMTGGWVNLTNTLAYQLDYDYHAAGTGSGSARWEFDNLPTGSYQVFTKWIPFSNRATNVPYTILDGSSPLATVLVNQQLMPADDQSNGIVWQSMGTFFTSTGELTVRLNDNANGFVVADAVRIVRDGIAPQQPEMNVAGDRGIATGEATPSLEAGTDFGSVAAITNSVTHTFTIRNNGNADLHLTGSPSVTVSGAQAGDFTILVQPSSAIVPGFASTFQVIFHPSDIGLRQAIVSIANDDDTEHPYTFAVQGTGAPPPPAQFTVDDLSADFTAIGPWPASANSLSYAGAYRSASSGAGDANSSWSFHGLAPGMYDVFTTWTPFNNRATNAPYTIVDGNVAQTFVSVNQRQSPNDTFADGVMWELLTIFQVTTGELTVRLSNSANGFVVADAVRIIRQGAAIASVAPAVAHNSQLSMDVNGDTRITSSDALLVINELLSPQPAVSPLAAFASPMAMSDGADSTYYLDVNGDGRVTARDALMVIGYLLNPSGAQTATPQATPLTASAPSASVSDAETLSAVDSALCQLAAATESTVDLLPECPLNIPSTSTPSTAVSAKELLTPVGVRDVFASRGKMRGDSTVPDEVWKPFEE